MGGKKIKPISKKRLREITEGTRKANLQLRRQRRAESGKLFKREDLPAPGSVFTMPLEDGRIGICRVIHGESAEPQEPEIAVVASSWVGTEPPPLDSPAVRETCVSRGGLKAVSWFSEPPPTTFVPLGRIELSESADDHGTIPDGNWETLPQIVLAAWRWEHDWKAVLREEREAHEREQKVQEERNREWKAFLEKLTLQDLRMEDFLPTWVHYPPPAAREGALKAIERFIEELKGERTLTEKFVHSALKRCVKELNRLNRQHRFIETVEREDLHDALEVILSVAQFPDLGEEIEAWRTW